MASYNTLKNDVAAVVKTNGQGLITGANMQSTLNKIINCFGGFWLFGGFASRGNNPGTPDQNVAWIALDPGVYTHFGSVELHNGCLGIIYWDSGHFAIFEKTITFTSPILNINVLMNQPDYTYTSGLARGQVPSSYRHNGLIITYIGGVDNDGKYIWITEQYTNAVDSNFANNANWNQIYP